MGNSKKKLEFSRRFNATAEQVFNAWLDPEIASYWLFSNPKSDMSKRKIRIDARVGGSYSVIETVDGQDLEALGEYIEIDRPNKLVFTFGMPIFSPEFDTVTVTIAADGDGCILTLSHEHLPPEYHDDTENGWGKMYIRLEEILNQKKE